MRNLFFIFYLFNLNFCFAQKGTAVLNDSAALANLSMIYQLSDISTFELSNLEVEVRMNLIRTFIKQTNQELKSRSDEYDGWKKAKRYRIKNIGAYKIQIVPYLNDLGEQEIWINGFCSNHANWRSEVVWVFDGGNCYFTMRINLTSGELISSVTNGYI